MRNAAALTCVVLCQGTPSASQTVTGNDWLYACEGNAGEVGVAFCSGYAVGVIEGLRYGLGWMLYAVNPEVSSDEVNQQTEQMLAFCAPPEVDYLQYQDIAMNYLRAHPETRHMPVRGLMHQALIEAFPCAPLAP